MKEKRMIKSAVYHVLVFLGGLIMLYPLVWMVMSSFKPTNTIFQTAGSLIPETFTLENYINGWKGFAKVTFAAFLKNSLFISIIATIGTVLSSAVVAYGFARFNWKKRESTAFLVLSQRMLPAMAIVIPYFLMAMAARLLDTRVILIICYLLFNIPFTILMMRGFFEDIPMEIEEAGKIDGCNGLQVFKELILPLSLPGLTATAIFCLINSWNEFVFANFLTSVNAKTVPTSVMLFLSVSGTKWGEMAATGVLSSLPVILFGIIVQKYMIRGLTFGAVKG